MANDVATLKLLEENRAVTRAHRWTRGEKLIATALALATLSIQLAALIVAVGHG